MDQNLMVENIRTWIKEGKPYKEEIIKKNPKDFIAHVALAGKKTKALAKMSVKDAGLYADYIRQTAGLLQSHIVEMPTEHRELFATSAHLTSYRISSVVFKGVVGKHEIESVGEASARGAFDCLIAIKNVEDKTEDYLRRMADYGLCIGQNLPLPFPIPQPFPPAPSNNCNAEKGSASVAGNDLNKAVRDMKILCGISDF